MTAKDVKNLEMTLAYVLGTVIGDSTGDHRRVKLDTICDEWADYYIIGMGSDVLNRSWWLKYDGPHGAKKTYATLLTIDEGWQINHVVHLIVQAIQCHRKEVAVKKLKEE